MFTLAKYIFLWFALTQLTHCASAVARLDTIASKHALTTITFPSASIPLKGYINHSDSPSDTIYIYLEGDGRPWGRYHPNKNPNTHRATSLPLMITGKRDALYLFRPCYGWKRLPHACDDRLWTSARYSQQVVDLLHKAIDQHKATFKPKRYILVGHSGGATLALLLASTRTDISAVISIAGNLDHQAWTNYFHYLPLSESLVIPKRHTFPAQQKHWYLVGEADSVVPAKIQLNAIEPHAYSFIKRYADFGHQCCWERVWFNLIDEIEQQLIKVH